MHASSMKPLRELRAAQRLLAKFDSEFDVVLQASDTLTASGMFSSTLFAIIVTTSLNGLHVTWMSEYTKIERWHRLALFIL